MNWLYPSSGYIGEKLAFDLQANDFPPEPFSFKTSSTLTTQGLCLLVTQDSHSRERWRHRVDV